MIGIIENSLKSIVRVLHLRVHVRARIFNLNVIVKIVLFCIHVYIFMKTENILEVSAKNTAVLADTCT